MAEKKSKTDVTARDKSGREICRSCTHCGRAITNDRELMVVMDGRRSNKTYYRRDCWQRLLSPDSEPSTTGAGACPLT
ncbi:hypothetical protein F8S13_00605 [Chloroflexia bacterium SDU3-3]|nr:hypothetical protein F8S13_00605 [Chloroflexia bacterium SDU3-3]